jgi:hypothetical protein
LKLEKLLAFVLPFVIFFEQEFCLSFLATWPSTLGFIADRAYLRRWFTLTGVFFFTSRENPPFINESY